MIWNEDRSDWLADSTKRSRCWKRRESVKMEESVQ
jgi:hypothetical protein